MVISPANSHMREFGKDRRRRSSNRCCTKRDVTEVKPENAADLTARLLQWKMRLNDGKHQTSVKGQLEPVGAGMQGSLRQSIFCRFWSLASAWYRSSAISHIRHVSSVAQQTESTFASKSQARNNAQSGAGAGWRAPSPWKHWEQEHEPTFQGTTTIQAYVGRPPAVVVDHEMKEVRSKGLTPSYVSSMPM